MGPLLERPAVVRVLKRMLPSATQGRLIALAELLERTGIAYWLAGGWGVDALVGRQTRSHRDLDLVVRAGDMAALARALGTAGFHAVDRPTEYVAHALLKEHRFFEDRLGYTLDVHPVDLTAWPDAAASPFAMGSIAGRDVPCLSAEAQRAGRRSYPLDEKGIHDLRQLDLQAPVV